MKNVIEYPWPLRTVDKLHMIGAEIVEVPAPGLEPFRLAILFDQDMDFRLRAAAVSIYHLGLLDNAWALGESKGCLRIATRRPATWPDSLACSDGDVWPTMIVGESLDFGFGVDRIPTHWPSRDVAAQLLRRLYSL